MQGWRYEMLRPLLLISFFPETQIFFSMKCQNLKTG